MFRKLRIKMVLLNMGVVTAIIIAVMAFTYFSSQSILKNQAETIKIKTEESDFDFSKKPGEYLNASVLGNKMIIIPLDGEGNIVENEHLPRYTENNTRKGLLETITADKVDMEYISYDDRIYFTFFVEKDSNTIHFFIDATQERELNSEILKNTAFIGLLALIMIITASLFMTKKALEPIVTAWEKQKRFVSDASHELRTPVAVIKINMEIVGENDEATVEDNRKWIDNVNVETDRMSNLIEKLLFLSESDVDKKKAVSNKTAMNTTIEKVAANLKPLADKKGLAMEVDCKKVFVNVPDMDISRLGTILIENAIKYTRKGIVTVKTFEDNGNAMLQVRDSGDGIGKEHIDKIFERFYRVDRARSRKTGGYGLGLSIAKNICGNYNGKIHVGSERGKGSVFTVEFPLAK